MAKSEATETTRTRDEIETEIRGYKQALTNTDYLALKHADGVLSDAEYVESKQLRIGYREAINELEAELAALESEDAE